MLCDNHPGGPEPVPASAATGISVVDDTQAGATAKCKAEEAVVGGGGRSSGFYADETYIATSAPVDGPDGDRVPDDGWRAGAQQRRGRGRRATALDVYADLRPPRTTRAIFEYVRETRKVPDGTQRARTASCGQRERAGGGVESHSGYEHGLYINSCFPNFLGSRRQRLWVGTVDNYDTPDDKARKITTTAICKR